MKKFYNGQVIDMSSEEEIEHNQHLAELQTKYNDEATAKTQKATDQANGNQKLLDLGLSQAEATALTGYTPPAAD